MKIKSNIRTCFIILFTTAFLAACGTQTFNSLSETVSQTADGFAIEGYDAVAYQTAENAFRGSQQYEYAWKGAKWLFVSKENQERFASNPEKYAPQYGGYCAWSVSQGKVMKADPQEWKIVDGKLYLIQSDMVKEVWEKSQPELIKKSNENWIKMNNR
jgi:YHS domain-containing protein